MIPLKKQLFTFIFLLSLPLSAHAAPEFISRAEAEKFCLETWFPRLRLGHTPVAGEVQQFTTKLLQLYTDDIEILDPNNKDLFGTDTSKGKAQAQTYYEAILGNYTLWTFNILSIYPTPEGFVLRYEGLNAGSVERFEGVDIIELKRDASGVKISKIFEYYDRKPFFDGKAP